MLEQPEGFSQTFMQVSGSAQPTVSGNQLSYVIFDMYDWMTKFWLKTQNPFLIQKDLPGNNTRLIIPGMMIKKRGKNFKYPAIRVAARAWPMFLAANVLCTIT